MYNKTSEKFNTLITKPGRTFRARLLIGDEILEGISNIKLTNGSNNGDALTLGSTISQMATITMENPGVSLSGKEFTLQIGLKIDEDIEYIPMGVFITDKIEVKADKLSITAYDRMMKLSSGYISDLSDDTDTVSILNEMAQKSGVPISVEGLAAIPMAKPIGYTYREVLMYVSQLHGGFANVNREGAIEIHFWEDSGYVLDADMGINGFTAGDSYTVNKITCATGQDEEGNTTSISAGTGSGISISNPFMTQTILEAIYSTIKGFTYDTVTCPVILGDPRLDPWDLVTIQSAARTTHKVPVMSLEYAYDGGLNMTITSTISSESEESFDYKGPMQQFEERMVSKIAIVESLTAKKANIEDLEAVTARIDKITATDITTEYLEAHYVDLGMANIDKAWIETLLVKGDFLVDTIHGVSGIFSKDLTGVNISGDMIVANTLKADSLILQGDDGIYRRLNIDSLGELTVDSNPIYNEKLDGSVLVAQSVTATQIDVNDLFAQKITATDLHIIGDSTFGGVLNGATGKFSGKVYCDNGIYMKYSELDTVEHDSEYGIVAEYGSYAEGTALYLANGEIDLCLNGRNTMIDSKTLNIYAENTYFGGSVEFSDKIVLSANNTKIYATNTSGNTYNQLNLCNGGNQLTLGYGLYEAGIGSSNIYGNTINFYTKALQINFSNNRLLSSNESNVFGTHRLAHEALLFFDSYSDAAGYTSRKGWLGHNSTTNFYLKNEAGGAMYMQGSTSYYFDNTVRCSLGMTFGMNAYSTEYGIGTVWKDGNTHSIVARSANGLAAYFGWAGSSSYATVSKIRGRTVQYQNASGTSTLSDERLKKDFTDLDKWESFYDALEPCAFRMLAGSSGRYHIGFKAQQVEQALLDSGLTTKDFAGLVKTEYTPDEEDPERTELYESVGIKPGDVEYGVIYNEFVAMNTYQIKNLKERVCEQEQEFDYLRGQVETLTNMLQELYMQLYGTSTLNAET